MENSAYEVIRIDDSSWRIEDGVVRCFLFEGMDRSLLVDSGFGRGDIAGLICSLTEKPLVLVVSHADHDHIGGNSQFGKVLVHDKELPRYQEAMGEECNAEIIHDGDILDIGGRSFRVIWIPGHTPGGIALLDSENRIMIAGDNVQGGTIYLAGEGRDVPLYVEGLKTLKTYEDRFDTVYPSHGPFPVSSGIIDGLIAGTEKILKGEIEGTPAHPPFDRIAKEYDIGIAKIIC